MQWRTVGIVPKAAEVSAALSEAMKQPRN